MSPKPFILSLIDDDEIYQYGFKRTVEKSKFAKKVLVFSDGEQAINFMIDNIANAQELPDVIFLDINMPIMNGFEFMEEYVKLKPKVGKQITIYMVSSSIDPADIERAKSISELTDYIIKPVEESMLREIIEGLEGNYD
ncbi:Response regulator receiver domain-containing protein [Nonlabens sp. Hel1_33_55]|uniref:response regulator n=1 Tax=Nonlabens sp. Hel1_33_55 TaxID=1336802 RepID=UPI000875D890|nr:response regulator [Nonlabens sp. Hel1_33_55]SCX88394.1 Response regulator receiver domain-containing protein [Nonlabens sp. Hel1_33_55]